MSGLWWATFWTGGTCWFQDYWTISQKYVLHSHVIFSWLISLVMANLFYSDSGINRKPSKNTWSHWKYLYLLVINMNIYRINHLCDSAHILKLQEIPLSHKYSLLTVSRIGEWAYNWRTLLTSLQFIAFSIPCFYYVIFYNRWWKVRIILCIFLMCHPVSKYLKALFDQNSLCDCVNGKDSFWSEIIT